MRPVARRRGGFQSRATTATRARCMRCAPRLDPGSMPTATRPSRFRLALDVRPSDYHLHLEPDLDAGRFRGEVRIDVRLERPRTEIVLHAADMAIEHAVAEVDGAVVPLRA